MYSRPEYWEKIAAIRKANLERRTLRIIKKCEKCGKKFEIVRRKKNGKYKTSKREKRFCSQTCANGHLQTEETKRRISKSLRAREVKRYKKMCPQCKKLFTTRRKFGIHCSRSCASSSRGRTTYDNFRRYKSLCTFRFDPFDFPDEFDLSLLEGVGFYRPTNSKFGGNLNGIMRDHILSARDGYVDKIDPKIISHPANCRLLTAEDNMSKNSKSAMTLEELLKKIEKWNKVYSGL